MTTELIDRSLCALVGTTSDGSRLFAVVQAPRPLDQVFWVSLYPSVDHPVGAPVAHETVAVLIDELRLRVPVRRLLFRIPHTPAAAGTWAALAAQTAQEGLLAHHRHLDGRWVSDELRAWQPSGAAPSAPWPEPPAPGHTELPTAVGGGLRGRHVELEPLQPSDLGWLYDLVVADPALLGWLFAGVLPNRLQFQRRMEAGVHQQLRIHGRSTSGPVGVVFSYDLRPSDGVISLGMLLAEEARALGWPIEALVLYVGHLFATLPLRKISIDTTSDRGGTLLPSLHRLATLEAHHVDHERRGRGFVDRYTFAIHRADVAGLAGRFGVSDA